MTYVLRLLQKKIEKTLHRGKSILLLGPRQTGKTTLLHKLPLDRYISLANLETRINYEQDLGRFAREIESLASRCDHPPLVAVDEIQKIPPLTDAIQDLIDRNVGQFILTGSSARKLRKTQSLNLLPGRLVPLHMDPLMIQELPKEKLVIEDLLFFGSLPEIILESDSEIREENLEAYVSLFLDEEIRVEAAVRSVGFFAQFLHLAAAESGNPLNFEKISQDIGVARGTIASYYQILEDCLVGERIEPLVSSTTRKRLVKTPKYLLFDVGIRRVSAKLGTKLSSEMTGHLFEEFVGLELLRQLRFLSPRSKLHFWRDANGPEVDWIVEHHGEYLPIEVKWTSKPSLSHVKHLKLFLQEYPAKKAYLICQIPYRQKLSEEIEAIPWQEIPLITEEFFQS
jgi:predicted AAA+ superfamily ATPase